MSLFLKNLLFTVLVPGSAGIWVPLWIVSRNGATLAPPHSPAQAAALLPMALGAAFYFWCMWNFATRGRGTPAPIDPPKVLVVSGPYRYVRNPMYVTVVMVVAGWWLYFRLSDLALYGGIFMVCAQLFVLFYEEPALRRLFGAQYERYCAEVRRWIPGRPFSERPPAA